MLFNSDILKELLLEKIDHAYEYGDEIRGRCCNPNHTDKHDSFSFNIAKGCGVCFANCEENITIKKILRWLNITRKDFVKKDDNINNSINNDNDNRSDIEEVELTYEEDEELEYDSLDDDILCCCIHHACDKHIKTNNIEIPVKRTFYYNTNKYPLTIQAYNYLSNRGFKDKERLIDEFHVGFDSNTIYNNLNAPSIMIPVFENKYDFLSNKCYFIQRRYIGDNPEIPRYLNITGVDKKTVLYGLDHCSIDSDTIIVCEGILDTLSWLWLGFNSVCTFGANLSSNQLDKLYTKNLIINYDNDKAGNKGYNNLIKLSSKIGHKLPIINFLTDRDANNYLLNNEQDILIKKLENVVNKSYL